MRRASRRTRSLDYFGEQPAEPPAGPPAPARRADSEAVLGAQAEYDRQEALRQVSSTRRASSRWWSCFRVLVT